ncbi:MAG: hypothetical protein HOL22_05830 [Euryarchaeota archaeon]|nr:hypothetical protein [Euryarchaeota archaeon]
MERLDFEDDRLWSRLLILGILLNVIVCFTSDLGLDTQVKMAVDENGTLPWGDLRPEIAGESDPTDGGQRIVLPLYEMSEFGIKTVALLTFVGMVACLYRWSGVRSAAILSLSPAFIFSVGRGYEEVYLAMFCAAAFILFTGLLSSKYRPLQSFLGGLSFMLMPYAKGFTDGFGVLIGALVLATFSTVWSEISRRGGEKTKWMSKPHVVGIVVSAVVSMSMVILGILGYNSTLSILAESPVRYTTAFAFSILDVIIIFTFFGMALWPFVGSLFRGFSSVEDTKIAMMTGYIVGLMTAIVFYVAALWTYEASIWGADWPGVIWTMGNNGRYATLLFIPMVLLLQELRQHIEVPTFDSPLSKAKGMGLVVLLLLPLSLLASFHGQTMWTDDAASTMELERGEEFLFVSEDTLGMHWLYTFYAPLDAEEKAITGHWRSIDSNWESDLNSSLLQVTTLVVSPDVKYTPNGWIVESSGEVDLLNGKGEWRVLTRS